MNILEIENKCLDLGGDTVDFNKEIWFSILDYSDKNNPDFIFNRLVFIEEFDSTAIVVVINGTKINIPYNWHIAIGCSDNGGPLEIIPVSSIQSQEFDIFVYNPLTSFRHEYLQGVQIGYTTVLDWVTPRIGDGQMITVPIESCDNPRCIFISPFCDESHDQIDIWKLL